MFAGGSGAAGARYLLVCRSWRAVAARPPRAGVGVPCSAGGCCSLMPSVRRPPVCGGWGREGSPRAAVSSHTSPGLTSLPSAVALDETQGLGTAGRRTGGQKDARTPQKEGDPTSAGCPRSRDGTARSPSSPPHHPPGETEAHRGGDHTAGHHGANSGPQPAPGTAASPASPVSLTPTPPQDCSLRSTPSLRQPGQATSQGAHTAQPNAPLAPSSSLLQGGDAPGTVPRPHPRRLRCGQPQSRGQSGQPTLAPLRGAVPAALLLASALLF